MAALLVPPLLLCCASSSSSSSSSSFGEATTRSTRKAAREAFLARPIDKEWERARRKETRDLSKRRRQEDEEEERQMHEYRRITSSFSECREEDVRKAKRLVASLIKSGEDIEEMIVEAADNGEFNSVVLVVIKTRVEIARQDDERDIVQALDLLYRRVEYEMMKRESSKSMQLLNDLLNLNDGSDHEEWIRRARHAMLRTFVPETAFTIAVSKARADEEEDGNEDEMLLRIDFIREVDEFIAETEVGTQPLAMGMDPHSVAERFKQAERQRNLECVRDMRDLAATLRW